MSGLPLMCFHFRNNAPAPVSLAEAERILSRGALRTNGDLSYIEWSNGFVEIELETEGCGDGEIIGFRCPSFTCMTFVDRLFDVADALNMIIVWDFMYVTKDSILNHYAPGIIRKAEDIIVVSSGRELAEVMQVVWINCGPNAEEVV